MSAHAGWATVTSVKHVVLVQLANAFQVAFGTKNVCCFAEKQAPLLAGLPRASTWALAFRRYGKTVVGGQQKGCHWQCLPAPSQQMYAMALAY